ncbi:acyl-CoA reductase-like NAD-dependent aldehyde dehydrogenase [Nesterenkonia lacusekhoensis]|uniref:Acyl-CoA reductase-like NAD-dependent aldehyde dehydrogenase n=1 Tax=Nesterenkonia lacusekhoensis TaxID=150832 RepID=A0ABS4T200_9MICC|nr:acyl-CoA reductase-like NAD-dependent aldehyde dehydrogenase [Nesterenkonia lacusekhoensis]
MGLLDTAVWDGKIFVDEWTSGSGGTRPVVEPATSQQLGTQGFATAEDVRRAAASAAAAQKDWVRTKPEERAALVRRAGDLFEEHAEEIHGWIQRESGGIAAKAGLETHVAAAECFDAAALPTLAQGEVLSSNDDRWSFARRRPLGVVSVIAPFNFPLILAIRAVAPALALGNAVLLKPDPRTTVSGGVTIMRIFEEAGLPVGLLPSAQACSSGARRQERDDRAGGCGPRSGRLRRCVRLLHASGPDLHGGRASHRPRRRLRRVRLYARRQGQEPAGGRPCREQHCDRCDHR